jgi:hypothetical protein
MALGGRGLSSGRGASLVGSDTGLSSGIGGLQGIDVEDGIHLNFGSNVHYRKAAGSPAVFAPFTTLFTFTRAAPDAYHFNKSGLLTTSSGNMPRINYTNGVCDGLLIEKNATNVALNNANLSAGTWTKSECTISTATSADGTTRNIRIVESANTGVHGVIAGQGIVAGSVNCLSAIVRPNGRNFAYIYGINTDQFGAMFDLVNLTTAPIIAGTSTISERGVIPLGNNRFLIYVSGVLNAGSATINFVGGPATSMTVPAGYSYAGDGSSGIDMEFIQNEPGTFPTSRILTAGGSVTRAIENSVRVFSSEVTPSVGTVNVKAKMNGGQDAVNPAFVWILNDNTSANRIFIARVATTDTLRYNLHVADVGQGPIDNSITDFGYFNCSSAWASNDLAISYNNGIVATDTSATIPATTQIQLGCEVNFSASNTPVKSFDYWPERVNNTILRGL